MLRRLFASWARGLDLMVRPKTGFQRVLDRDTVRVHSLKLMLFGTLLVQLAGEWLGVTSEFPMGRVMSGALILGPLVGILLIWLTAVAVRAMASLLRPELVVVPAERTFRVPLPFRRLLWNRIFGRNAIRLALSRGRLQGYQRFWNRFRNRLARTWAHVSGGPPLRRLMGAAAQTTNPLLLLAVVRLIELIVVDKNEPSLALPFFLIEALLLLWFLGLWVPLVLVYYRLKAWQCLVTILLSFCLSGILVVMFLRYIFAVPIPGL